MRALPTGSNDVIIEGSGASAEAPHASDVWPRSLTNGWQCMSTAAGACATPADCPADGWIAAQVPGTVASALRATGRFDAAQPEPLAYRDHWYRVTLAGTGRRRLRFHGLATFAQVWLDDALILESASMFEAHDVDVDLTGTATLSLCFRSLQPALDARRTRARWKPRLVQPPTLRNVRTTLLGHMPGWCPSVHAVGPWRPVEVLGGAINAFDLVDLSTRVEGADGVVSLRLTFVEPPMVQERAVLKCGDASASLQWQDARTLTGELRVPNAELWWPHTHGRPAQHEIALSLGANTTCPLGEVAFRTLEVDHGADGDGFGLRVNGVGVFCRGACWTSADLVTLTGTDAQLTHALTLARDAGMNMLRIGGTMVYESDAFYALAQRLGILVWQDFAFANFDYPADDVFRQAVEREATQFLARTRRFASLAVLCGGSEADQQAAMFGLEPSMREQTLFTQQLPSIAARERPDVPYVGNSPSGGVWPFSTRRGVTHYYGVGAYQRPLDDARRAQVRFTSECLAFANVPDDATLHDALHTIHSHDPRWKAAVPRDPGAGWDFDDVRDHYLRTLYEVEPARLRYEDPQRYLMLSRAVVADVMTDVMSEFRRAGSTCEGALVWQFQDLRAGAGWGIVDATGRPKSAWHALAQVLQPVQVVITDEGLDGLDIHCINDTPRALHARLELACLRDGAVSVASANHTIELAAHSKTRVNAAECLGRFFDFTYAYRFGPRAHDVTIATLRDAATGDVLSEAFHLPERCARERYDLGLTATLEQTSHGWQLTLATQRFARHVHITDAHYRAERDWFHLAPHQRQTIALLPRAGSVTGLTPNGEVLAINARTPAFYS